MAKGGGAGGGVRRVCVWKETGENFLKIPVLFLIGGGVSGVRRIMSSKCCEGARRRQIEILRNT